VKKWTFFTNHGAVLSAIAKNRKVRAVDIAIELGITERSVRRIIADLTAAKYITKKRGVGANLYEVNRDLPLRRESMQYIKIKDLIKACSHEDNNHR
jgi:Mn-dependent DtxR family transcriptional regulator